MTICVHERECALGDVIDGELRLNEIGQMVQETWDSLSGRYPAIDLDAFVVMPNHAHGVIVIDHDRRGAVAAPIITASNDGKGEGDLAPA